MSDAIQSNNRFNVESGWRVSVQVPADCEHTVFDAVLESTQLRYGDYEAVTFSSAVGTQNFRSLGSGRNRPNQHNVKVPTVELSFFFAGTAGELEQVIRAIYDTHPYEEPVVYVDRVDRTLHIRGIDEDNPNRFWNRSAANEWVPHEFEMGTAP